jgi:RNA recognition motif-containing protein
MLFKIEASQLRKTYYVILKSLSQGLGILLRGRFKPDLSDVCSPVDVTVRRKMESKLYVGNLSYSTTEEDLRNLFFQAGTVTSVALIKDRDSGRSKGFAFVEMSNQVEAQKAISMFNGHNLGDRELRVSIAQPREERGGFRDRGSGHSRRPPQRGGNKRY